MEETILLQTFFPVIQVLLCSPSRQLSQQQRQKNLFCSMLSTVVLLAVHKQAAEEHVHGICDDNLKMRHTSPQSCVPRDFAIPVTSKQIKTAQLQDPAFQKLWHESPIDQAKCLMTLVNDLVHKMHGPFKILRPVMHTSSLLKSFNPNSQNGIMLCWCILVLTDCSTPCTNIAPGPMRKCIGKLCEECSNCQKGKTGLRGHGKVPLKDIEMQPRKDC